MPKVTSIRRVAERALRALGVLGWVAIAGGFAVEQVVADQAPTVGQSALVWTLTVFFMAQVLRLAIAVVIRPRQRTGLVFLLASVLLWAAGSALLNAGGVPDLTRFPAPGEPLFLASYVAMAAYLVVSVTRDVRAPADTWLHILVICGGTVSLAGSLLLSPIGHAYSGGALGLFLALLYPLLDLVLAVLVIGQALLRMRENLSESATLLAAFLLFTFADSHFVTDLSSGTYHFSVLSDAAWGGGFALIVGVACRAKPLSARVVPRRQGSAETLVAAGIAVVVLALAPFHGVGLYLTVPAVLTLAGAGGRLALALREARGAAEAFALSRTDDLTRLGNRRALHGDLDAAIEDFRPLSLILLDLDGFKDVNDTLGHTAGDEVLRLMAHRLRHALPASAGLARLGGDEFAVSVYSADELAVTEIAQGLLAQVRETVRVDGIEILPSASVGVAICPPEGVKSSELLRRADVAMYQAKHNRLGVALYDAADDDFSKAKLRLAEDLRKALDEQQFELWYQPQIDVLTQQVCGLEGLLRWRHPTEGTLVPVSFLPAARQAGLMPAISARVAQLAVRDLRSMRAVGVDVRVAINCAPAELLSGTFLHGLYAVLDKSPVPADRLLIEVTEDSFIAEPERARLVIQDIRDHGLQVAIDDYGTGFSSLAYLRDLAIDELKIDRTFISSMLADERTRMIVTSTLRMADALCMRTVAEGVEDEDTARALAEVGVDVIQGYHIARPMPPSEIAAWVKQWQIHRGEPRVVADPPAREVVRERPARARRSLRVLS
jgi:diguanylate cyclase